MAVVAGVSDHIRMAERLIAQGDSVLDQVARVGVQRSSQMQVDLQTVSASATLASAHIAMAHFLQYRNDS